MAQKFRRASAWRASASPLSSSNGLDACVGAARRHGGAARRSRRSIRTTPRPSSNRCCATSSHGRSFATRARREGARAGAAGSASRKSCRSAPAASPLKRCCASRSVRCRCPQQTISRRCSSPAAPPAFRRAPTTPIASLMAYCYGVAALWPFPLDEERILNVAPLFHVWGFCFTLVMPIYIRAFMDIMPAYKPALVLEEFQKRKITVFAGGPAALYLGLRAEREFRQDRFLQPENLPLRRRAVPGGTVAQLGKGDRLRAARRLGHVGRRADQLQSALRRAQGRLGRHRAAEHARSRSSISRPATKRHAGRRARRNPRARARSSPRAIATARRTTSRRSAMAGSTPATSATTTPTAICSWSTARRK